jgi:hypothetical protein
MKTWIDRLLRRADPDALKVEPFVPLPRPFDDPASFSIAPTKAEIAAWEKSHPKEAQEKLEKAAELSDLTTKLQRMESYHGELPMGGLRDVHEAVIVLLREKIRVLKS